MKTFNSIFANGNVKSIIAIAVVAISSVFGLSSCEKDNDAFNTTPQTNQPGDPTPTSVDGYEYSLCFDNKILSLGDIILKVEDNGQVYKASEAPSTTKKGEFFDFDCKQITIKNLKSGSKITAEFIPNADAIAALPSDAKQTYGITRSVTTIYTNGVHKVSSNDIPGLGVDNNKVESWLTRRITSLGRTF